MRISRFSIILLGLSLVSGVIATHEGFKRSTAAIRPSTKSAPPWLGTIKNWGLFNNQGKSHIYAADAWKLEEGSKSVVVAVIDTGVDANHIDLRANLWAAQASRGFAAQANRVYGWDFVTNSPNPRDEHGHGTHVAGIIGATTDSKNGVSGVAHNVSIMPVRYYSDSNPGSVNLTNTIKAINYAIDHGARIINYSGGGPSYSQEEYLALKRAENEGILVVAAAGNEKQDTDVPDNFYYPAAYGLSNIITVAATNINNHLLERSNWGKRKVDVAAPGENIYSTLPYDRYGMMSGTSQATAFVTGLAALVLSKRPTLTPQQVKKIILATADPIPELREKIASGGRINAYKALVATAKGDFATLAENLPDLGFKPVAWLDFYR